MKNLLLAGLLFLSFVCPQKTLASSAFLSWNPGASPATAGYYIYYGTVPGVYLFRVNAGNATSVTISNLTPGVTYYFAASSYDTAGLESQLSSPINYLAGFYLKLIKSALPGSPVILQFQMLRGHRYEILASTDLQTWTPIWLSNLALADVLFEFTDINAVWYPSRFYRYVEY